MILAGCVDLEDDKDLIELKPGVGGEETKDSKTKDEELGGGESKAASAGLSQETAGGSGEGVGIVTQDVREEGERAVHPEGGAMAAAMVTGGRGAGDSKASEEEDKGGDDSRDADVTEGQDVADTKQVSAGTGSVFRLVSAVVISSLSNWSVKSWHYSRHKIFLPVDRILSVEEQHGVVFEEREFWLQS